MKKSIVSMLSLCLGLSAFTTSCTSYKEDKVYTQKEVKTYKENEQINKTEYITRNEAVKIAKDLFKQSIGLDLDEIDLKEKIVLYKDEKQNKFEWELMWQSEETGREAMIIDALTGEIKELRSGQRIISKPGEVYKLTKNEIDELIGNTLKLFGRNMDNYKVEYEQDNPRMVYPTDKLAKSKKDVFIHKDSLENGYVRWAIFRLRENNEYVSVSIDAKEKKVVGISIFNNDYIERLVDNN